MIYGLYLSAAGVVANSHRQDVITNNLANSETTGFKRDLALFQERLTEAQFRREGGMPPGASGDRLLEELGGGLLLSPTTIDNKQGELEHTSSPLDVAVEGDGYFAVRGERGETRLTRNGRFMVDREGSLVLSDAQGHKVLDPKGKPIRLPTDADGKLTVDTDGTIKVGSNAVGQIGAFDVADRSKLTKQGGTLLAHPDAAQVRPTTATLRSGFVERANVDPTTELAQLMECQRQLEANANMIRYQDQTLAKLVNEVGKIG